MGLCIIMSLTDEAERHLNTQYHEFMFNKVIYMSLFVQVVMCLAIVDRRAMTAVL